MINPYKYNQADINELIEAAADERLEIAMERATRMQHELGITVYPIEVKGEYVYTVDVAMLTASRASSKQEIDSLKLALQTEMIRNEVPSEQLQKRFVIALIVGFLVFAWALDVTVAHICRG